MTTIACNREEMAADSRVTDGSGLTGETRKLYRSPHGLIACAGPAGLCKAFVDAFRATPRSQPVNLSELRSEGAFFALLLSPERDLFWFDAHMAPIELENPYHAIGSGGAFAMGAMAAGANPSEAVRIACRFDPYSGGKVRMLRVSKPSKDS